MSYSRGETYNSRGYLSVGESSENYTFSVNTRDGRGGAFSSGAGRGGARMKIRGARRGGAGLLPNPSWVLNLKEVVVHLPLSLLPPPNLSLLPPLIWHFCSHQRALLPPLICIICPPIMFSFSEDKCLNCESESVQFEESERQVYNIILIKALTNQFESDLILVNLLWESLSTK